MTTPDEGHPLKIFHGLTMRDESIRLDGKHFVDCSFIDCTLEYSGGDIILERTSIHGCKHVLYGYARQTAAYLRAVGLYGDSKGEAWTEYAGNLN